MDNSAGVNYETLYKYNLICTQELIKKCENYEKDINELKEILRRNNIF